MLAALRLVACLAALAQEEERHLDILSPELGGRDESKGTLPLKSLALREVLTLVPHELLSMGNWWSSEGILWVRVIDDRSEQELRWVVGFLDRDACTPRKEAARDAFDRVVSEWLALSPRPEKELTDEQITDWIRRCEAIVKDASASADARLFSALLAIRGYWRLTREAIVDATRARILKPALELIARAEAVKGGREGLSLVLAHHKGRILSVSERRKEAIAHYTAAQTTFKALAAWPAYKAFQDRIDRLRKGD